LKQHGIRGYKIKRTRWLAYRDGTTHKETNTDLYPSTTEIYEVPPSFDVSLLPPLPDDAKDEGEGSAPPIPSLAPAPVACTENCAQPALDVVEGPGAHAPTEAQENPPKTLMLVR